MYGSEHIGRNTGTEAKDSQQLAYASPTTPGTTGTTGKRVSDAAATASPVSATGNADAQADCGYPTLQLAWLQQRSERRHSKKTTIGNAPYRCVSPRPRFSPHSAEPHSIEPHAHSATTSMPPSDRHVNQSAYLSPARTRRASAGSDTSDGGGSQCQLHLHQAAVSPSVFSLSDFEEDTSDAYGTSTIAVRLIDQRVCIEPHTILCTRVLARFSLTHTFNTHTHTRARARARATTPHPFLPMCVGLSFRACACVQYNANVQAWRGA